MADAFNRIVLPATSLCQRELVRFVRQRTRIVGALITPVLFWAFFGAGMANSFHPDNLSFKEYFYPGTIIMILLFTAIFSTISIIEDRREGFLQSVLVAPVSRMAIVLGKILGGTVLATGQGLLFLLLAPAIGIKIGLTAFLIAIVIMLVVSFALTGLGVCIAWRMNSTQGFHVIMNMFLMPMWFLSGALFPASGATPLLARVMSCNPLSYGVSGLRRALYWSAPASPMVYSWSMSLGVSLVFAATMFACASWIARGRISADLQ